MDMPKKKKKKGLKVKVRYRSSVVELAATSISVLATAIAQKVRGKQIIDHLEGMEKTMREEVGGLREEVGGLRDEMKKLRELQELTITILNDRLPPKSS